MAVQNPQYRVPHAEAVKLLDITKHQDGDYVHTFRDGGLALIGADWAYDKLVALMEREGVEEAGPMAQRMRHALLVTDELGPLFIATLAPYMRPIPAPEETPST